MSHDDRGDGVPGPAWQGDAAMPAGGGVGVPSRIGIAAATRPDAARTPAADRRDGSGLACSTLRRRPPPPSRRCPRRVGAVATALALLVIASAAAGRAAPDDSAAQATAHLPSASEWTLYFVANEFLLTGDAVAADGAASSAERSASILGSLYDTNVARFTPGHDAAAVKVVSTPEIAALIGDADGDGDYWALDWGDIDALGTRRHQGPFELVGMLGWPDLPTPDLVFSTEAAWGGAHEGLSEDHHGAVDGTLFSLRRDGEGGCRVQIFLSEQQILSAIGQLGDPTSDGVDVDAFTQDESGNIYLSFRHDEPIRGVMLADEGVVLIPWNKIWYDEAGDVHDLFPDAAVVALDAGAVDAMVAQAGVTRASGTVVEHLGDLQGLAIDPAGGLFHPIAPIAPMLEGLPNLLFTGERIGATVLSTRDCGSIAVLNGRELGSRPMNGAALGLSADSTATTHDLNALHVGRAMPAQICLDVASAEVLLEPGARIEFAAGNLPPGTPALVLLSLGPTGAYGQACSRPAGATRVYPDVLVDDAVLALVGVADASGRIFVSLPVDTAPGIALWVIAQAVDLSRGRLSAPAAVWCPRP